MIRIQRDMCDFEGRQSIRNQKREYAKELKEREQRDRELRYY